MMVMGEGKGLNVHDGRNVLERKTVMMKDNFTVKDLR
jgi:hypothetical protein